LRRMMSVEREEPIKGGGTMVHFAKKVAKP
jgi:hypothetical protein